MYLFTWGCEGGEQAKNAAEGQGAAGEPATTPPVQSENQQRVGGELGRAGDCEGDEHVEPQWTHAPHMAVVHQGHDHPWVKTAAEWDNCHSIK